MKRGFMSVVALCLCMIFVTACTASSYTAVMSVESSDATSWNLKYESLNGKRSKNINVTAGSECLMSFAVTTDSGALSVEVYDSDNNLCGSADMTNQGSYDLHLDSKEKDERYKVVLVAQNHSGSVELEWTEMQKE